MAINTITINGSPVSFKYGLTITDVLSKELNTGILVIPQTANLDIEPLDEVVITYEVAKVIRMVVAQINEKIVNHEGAKKYVYTIGLASPTLKLQRIVLPSRTITNSLDGSDDKTIYQVIQELLEVYAPNEYTLSAALQAKTATVTCPEFSWNRPTLFEVLNDILSVVGCVVTVTGSSTLSVLDLYSKQNAIDETKLSNYEINRNVAEYASAIEVQASNVYDNINTKTGDYVVVETTEQALLTTENQQIILQKPIFQIKKIKVTWLADDTVGLDISARSVDITYRVVEKSVYDTFYNSDAAGRLADTTSKKYRRNYLYYTQGSNTIDGFGLREDDWIPYSNGTTAFDNVLYWALQDSNDLEKNAYNATNYNSYLTKKVLFEVEYLAADDVTFRVIKEIQPRNKSVLINAQTNAEVYARSLGKQQQEFVNRIGNEEMTITGRYAAYNDIPKLNDYIGNFIVTAREIVFYDTFYLFKGILSENYTKDNMFAGINTSKRYTEIASPSKALISNHINENIFKLSTTSGASNSVGINNYFLQFGKFSDVMQGAIVQTIKTKSTTYPYNHTLSDKFLMEGSAHIFGNSIVYGIKMPTNASAGTSLEPELRLLFDDVQSMKQNPYVNDLGRFYAIAVRLYKKGGIINGALDFTFGFGSGSFANQRANFEKATDVAAKMPKVEDTETYIDLATGNTLNYTRIIEAKKIYNFLDTGPFSTLGLLDYKKRYKDNREITAETVQFHFLKDTNAFFTDKFLEYSPFTYKGTSDIAFKIAYSNTLTYTSADTDYKGTLVNNNSTVKITTSGNQIYIEPTVSGQTWWDANATSQTSWAICDANGKIILARNGNLTQKLYLNSVSIV